MNSRSDHSRATSVLKAHWGYDGFRPGQWDVVAPALAGRDTLGILATGGGKSVCYQIPGLLIGGLCLVVSPLVALMSDQVEGLVRRGVSAASLTSSLSVTEAVEVMRQAAEGRLRFVFVSPERFDSAVFRRLAPGLGVRLLVVDEAHCISEWGTDFRPAYRRIPAGRRLLGMPPVIALTATAPPRVRRDIVRSLGLSRPAVVIESVDRPNLFWQVSAETDRRRAARIALSRTVGKDVNGGAVAYAATRRRVEDWTSYLRFAGLAVSPYHGGLPRSDRDRAMADWMSNRTPVVVGTNAFGMGIDRADVRLVVHLDPPPTIESYYQEAGRAGRDGEPAVALMLFRGGDDRIREQMLNMQPVNAGTCKSQWVRRLRSTARLRRVRRYAGLRTCRRRFLLAHFGEPGPVRCGSCDNCHDG